MKIDGSESPATSGTTAPGSRPRLAAIPPCVWITPTGYLQGMSQARINN